MRLLLDTHIFLWFISGDPRLLDVIRDAIQDPANEAYLSPVSLWEIIVKNNLGKLPLPNPPQTYILEQRRNHGISTLSLDEDCVTHLANLPALHRDPFDRMLICQALHYGLTLVIDDATVRAYPVPTL